MQALLALPNPTNNMASLRSFYEPQAILKEIKVFEESVYVNPQSLTDSSSITAVFITGTDQPQPTISSVTQSRWCCLLIEDC